MPNHIYTVEFRFDDDVLDMEKITREMMLEPSLVRLPHVSRTGRKRGPVWGYNGYGEEGFAAEWSSLEEGLVFLFARLDNRIEAIRKLSKEYKSIWWCGHFQSSFDGGPTLRKDCIDGLHKFGVPIFIDNYLSE